MASDAQVTASMILNALHELERKGSTKLMQELEAAEPDLAEHVIESLTAIHQRLTRTGAAPRELRSVYRLVRRMVLVSVMALRHGHYELWRQQSVDTPLSGLDVDESDGGEGTDDGPPPELT